nr:MAG TPA: hypothetical protein [Caudoviricetes sp.]
MAHHEELHPYTTYELHRATSVTTAPQKVQSC